MAKPMGRPPKPPGEKRTRHLTVPLSEEEEREIRAAVSDAKLAVWARETLLAVARLGPGMLDEFMKRARLEALAASLHDPPTPAGETADAWRARLKASMHAAAAVPVGVTPAPLAMRRPPLFDPDRQIEPGREPTVRSRVFDPEKDIKKT